MMPSPGSVSERPAFAKSGGLQRNRFAAGLTLLGVGVLAASMLFAAENTTPQNPEKPRKAKASKNLLREGWKLDQVSGRFEPAGNRFAFVAEDSSGRYIVLENLNLERIVKMADVYPVPIRWTISGVITEYDEENFLLVETATFSSLFRKAESESTAPPGEPTEETP